VTNQGPTPEEAARYLRQRGEVAGGEIFLSGLSARKALELAREARRAGRASGGKSMDSKDAQATPPKEISEGEVTGVPADYDGLRTQALDCRRCGLADTRKHVVFSDGNPRARLMVVGEAPGAREDETGRAFVGPAGKLLDLLLATVGLSRERSVYICNVLKCRPPGNRDPLPEEIQTCTPYLRRQIQLIAPEAILAVGSFAARFLTGREESLGRLRGEVYSYQGVPVVVTYHPAALLRNSGWTRATWDDLQFLLQIMPETDRAVTPD